MHAFEPTDSLPTMARCVLLSGFSTPQKTFFQTTYTHESKGINLPNSIGENVYLFSLCNSYIHSRLIIFIYSYLMLYGSSVLY